MQAPPIPVVLFGDLDADVWGVLLGGDTPQLAVAGLTSADVAFDTVDLDLEDGEVWTLTGNGCALRVERADSTTNTPGAGAELEPCRVSGAVTVERVERELDIGGVRSVALTLEDRDSLRLFGSWFPAGHELALLSARPRGAKGHDRDRVEVVARGESHPVVFDPRVSTTYDREREPRRVGIELWLGEDEEGELFSRRVAGAATGSRAERSGLSAHAFACASRGESGAGIYMLLTGF